MRSQTDNILNSDATITVSSSNPANPKSNLYNQYLSSFLMFDSNTAEYVLLDAGSGNTFDLNSLGIAGHNLTSGATIKLQANNTDVWTSPSVDETVTWYENEIVYFLTTIQQYRYIRVYFDDASNPYEIEIGYLYLGLYEDNPDFGRTWIENHNVSSRRKITQSGQISGALDYMYRSIELSFPFVTIAEKNVILSAFKRIYNFKVGFFTPFEGDLDQLNPIYGILSIEALSLGHLKYREQVYNISIEIREGK